MLVVGAMAFDYDDITAGYYDKIFKRKNGVQSRWHRDKFTFVGARLPNRGLIVDIGCGPGTFIGNLDNQHRQFIGIDAADNQISYAITTYGKIGKKFLKVSTPPYPIDDNSVDAVTAIEFIEHLDITSIEKVISEAHRILRPGGSLFLTTPNYGSFWPILEWIVGKISPLSYDEQHITRFTRYSLISMLELGDFQDIKVSAFMFSAPFAAAIHWRVADVVEYFEPNFLTRRLGFLLFCEARKADLG